MLPVALSVPVTTTPVGVITCTLGEPPTVVTAFPPEVGIVITVVPFWICVTATLPVAVTLLKKPPSPIINPPCTFPVVLIKPVACKFTAETLPVLVILFGFRLPEYVGRYAATLALP